MSKPKKFWADTPKARYLKTDSDIEFMYLKPIYLKSKNTRRKSILTRNKVKRNMKRIVEFLSGVES
jgi:hypothetical protein